MKFIDLFCGIGGFRLALESRGLECVFSSEIDPHARRAYANNFGETPSGDITEVPSCKIPRHDVLCAGFPCQSFSISGKRGSLGDGRGRLFFEIARIAAHCRPSVLILENVKNILSIDGGGAMRRIEATLCETGYRVRAFLLNSSFFGVPQARERVYFLAVRKDLMPADELGQILPPTASLEKIYLEDALDPDPDPALLIDRDFHIAKPESGVSRALKPIRVGHVNKGGQGERIYSPKGHAITQSAHGGGAGAKTGLYATARGVRRLSVDECKRVMGFPARHRVGAGSQGYRQLGNAVVPGMIGAVFGSCGHFLD